ncbi:hypothetical protein EV368DRAFT_65221 [Lentinula lateritia]|nr:hypothetical protein EV368DRAFT_65221 [Lentinula lateritia]
MSMKIVKANAKKEFLTNLLIDWRTNGIQEMQEFVWPYFTPNDISPPTMLWAPPCPPGGTGGTINTHKFAPGQRLELLKELGKSMNYSSALGVGGIHRVLQQPLARGEQEDELRKVLRKFAGNSLVYRIQQVVCEVVTPAWVTNPPLNVGLYEAGTLKADNWRTLFSIHVPLATLSFWKEASPVAAANASDMTSVVDTVMHLACASLVMTKCKLSSDCRKQFRHLLWLHILGLKKNFPGWIFPTHHLAFHIHEFMDLFSGVRHWWLFPFEKLIGKLQCTPTNHKPGEFEHTLLHSFYTGAFFHQWMMRPNAPPFLRYCQKLIDKAYNYDHRASTCSADDDAPDQPVVTSEFITSNFIHPISNTIASASELTNLLGAEPFESFTHIPATKGDYTIPIKGALGNSFVCFRQKKNDSIQVALLRSQSVRAPDPFSDFWASGFEAKLVSSKFSPILEVIGMKQIAAHSARWALSDELVVAVNLCSD